MLDIKMTNDKYKENDNRSEEFTLGYDFIFVRIKHNVPL